MEKKISTLAEIEKLFRNYYGEGLTVVSRNPYQLVLEVSIFPSKFTHSFDKNIFFSVMPSSEYNTQSLIITFYITK